MDMGFKKGDWVVSTDPEDEGAEGVVLDTTLSGGVKVHWSGGADVWTTADGLEPAPTKREWDWEAALFDGETVLNEVTGTWRHGSEHRRVFKLDGRYYAVAYRMTPDHGISDRDEGVDVPDVVEVEPVERTVVDWVEVSNA